MENGTAWGVWIAYVAIVVFLVLLVALLARTMMLFGTLTLMPLSRIARRFARFFGRGRS
jgi:Ni/Fe-hydrogenase subunit HybB-like protein